ncbi:DUF4244 domain-containing protein [Kineosporia sp. NBRC 101731]|uniref:DUF4244 domain-containing protein n=1 Tax=Kineosporia sp. NBRC 101731 TaxID=3032199 RepID=UPI0024A18570|nr:DUF4244 domain-containing protein [Kineosporia sp. NBRC 101731]GLY31082.1 hypothetical protein Kisp02_44470 [Kineosporia sp. NBRC 101731]
MADIGAADPAGGTGHGERTAMQVRAVKSGHHFQERFSAALRRRRDCVGSIRQMRERGASTAEYAMTMLAACAFAGVLLAIIRSSAVKGLVLAIIQKALSI